MPRRIRTRGELLYSPAPLGIGHTKPHHYLEMARVAWENRDNLAYAWKILSEGVCDGCALGTTGLRDWTIDGTHLCMVRLELLRLNTMPAMDHSTLADVSRLRRRTGRELLNMGRLAYPMRRRRGEPGFQRVSWEEVWREAGPAWRAFDPERTFLYLTSRGITNEVYYTAQKAMRFLGSPNVDNSARLCHAPSTGALKRTLGVAATTCSYRDWYEADVIVFFGSNPANDQPVTMKYLADARRRGARVLMVNAFREPGMERYWIPSNWDSALFGTRITDRTFLVKVGGDLEFMNAVQKILIGRGWVRDEFIASATSGFEALKEALDAQPMEALLAGSGVDLGKAEAFARELAEAETGVFVWSMGLTQHAHSTDTITGLVNLALLREYVGRPGCGLMPIRGHSGVQGGAEMGAYATAFPGGLPVNPESAARFSRLWGFPVPDHPGMTTVAALEAAYEGRIDGLYTIGGNFLRTLPQPERVEAALAQIPLRIHTDIVVTSQMLVDPAGVVFLLPARTRYEQRDGGTETTTERRVIFSPYIPGHDVGEARSEWEILLDLARAVKPEEYEKIHFDSGAAIRRDIARAVPAYSGIERLSARGDQFQWGGKMLCAGREFPTPDGKAHFLPVVPPGLAAPPDDPNSFILATRRGKQFNSMVQRGRDPLTGAERDHVFISREDASRLNLAMNDPVVVSNEHGEFRGRAFIADLAEGTLQAHWPEALVLIPPGRTDGDAGIPDYNARVTLRRAG